MNNNEKTRLWRIVKFLSGVLQRRIIRPNAILYILNLGRSGK